MTRKTTTTKKDKTIFVNGLKSQRAFCKQKEGEGFKYPLIAAAAFVRGMRDSGYKSNATALFELVDNSIQAGAKKVDLVLGYEDGSKKKKVEHLAIADNGHGMDPEMIRMAVLWGGTHREGDRGGFGRYGFGLPSASVSMTKRYSVFSRVEGGDWQAVTIDLEAIGHGEFTDSEGMVIAPKAVTVALPDWLGDYADWEQGTIVVLWNIDRPTPGYKTSGTFTQKMLEHFGLAYRGILRSVRIQVVDLGLEEADRVTLVEPVDPLFLTPGARYYDEGVLMAEALPATVFQVNDKKTRDEVGTVTVRYSYLPPGFQSSKPDAEDPSPEKWKPCKSRFKVMKATNGFVVMRAGRLVDIVIKNPWLTFINYDRNLQIEIDFTPTLDEEFGVTTNKQQITISDRMWDLLKENGVWTAIKAMRERFRTDKAAIKKKEKGKKASEKAMEDADKFRTRKPAPPSSDEEREKQKRRLKDEAKKRAEKSGGKIEDIEAELMSESYEVAYESLPGAPFYRPDQIGGLKQVLLNQKHRFYTDVYMGPRSSPELRAALETLLLVLGEAELSAEDDRRLFYSQERGYWSTRYGLVLDLLNKQDPVEDLNSATTETEESQA